MVKYRLRFERISEVDLGCFQEGPGSMEASMDPELQAGQARVEKDARPEVRGSAQ